MNPSDISLRPFCLSDVDDYFVWASDDQVSQFCGWNTVVAKQDVEKLLRNYIIPHPWYHAICLKDKPIGYIFANGGKYSERCRAEIGYTLASMYWGHGFATQAVKIAVSGIFDEWDDLERVEAQIDVENVRSQRVVEKAGFVKEGVLRKHWILKGRTRDMIMYSFLRPEAQHCVPDVVGKTEV